MAVTRALSSCGGVLCQLEAEGTFRAEAERWLPGFAAGDGSGGAEDGGLTGLPGVPGTAEGEATA
jgi:hypothetical protein